MVLEEYDKAFAYLEKASMMSPSNALKANSLAWRSFLHYWLGQTEQSLLLATQVPGMVHEIENYWIEGYGMWMKILISSFTITQLK